MAFTVAKTIDTLSDKAKDQETLNVGNVLDELKHKGFGPFLIILAMINILPSGAVPFLPALCALLIIGVSVQMLFQRETLWLPKKLRDVSINKKKFEHGLHKVKPWSQKLDKLFKPRLSVLQSGWSTSLIAITCIVLALSIIAIGFIPFAPLIPSVVIVFFGLGLMFSDGAMIGAGLVTFILALVWALMAIA